MKYLLSIIAIAAGIFFVIEPKIITEAVRGGVEDCLTVIIPSLFAFTVLAVYLQNSGLYRVALKPLTFPLSKILRMEEELCGVFVLANIAGYPVGAKLLSELVRSGRLKPSDGGRLLCCCFASGPTFVIGVVGTRVFGSVEAGLWIFLCGFATNLIIAVIMRFFGEITLKSAGEKYSLSAETFVNSVTDGAKVMFGVCVMITAFSAVRGILGFLGIKGTVVSAVLEVSQLKGLTPFGGAIALSGGLLMLGGICVLMQVMAVGKGLPLRLFLVTRIPAALLAAGLSAILERFVNIDTETLSVGMSVVPTSGNVVLSVSVLMMSVILLWQRDDWSKATSCH